MSVYKDNQRGTFYFRTRINGKQVKRRGFKTTKEARLAEAQLLLDDDINEDNPPFEKVADEYKNWYRKRRKPMSYTKMEGIVNNYLIPWFGKKQIDNIKNRDVMKFHDELIDKNSVATNKTIHVFLSAVFNFAIRNEYTTKNPARAVGNFDGKPEKHVNYWTLDEFKTFMSAVDDFQYYVLFMVLYYSGMRRGEVMALTWGDIDFDNNSVHIDKTLTKKGINSTKTGATRAIQMPTFVMRLLSQLKAQASPKMTYVVFGEFKQPISETTISRKFKEWIAESGVKPIRIHDLRHAHASYLINKGTVISVISQRLGHSNVSTTLDTYSHLYPTTEKEAVQDMEDDFKRADIFHLVQ